MLQRSRTITLKGRLCWLSGFLNCYLVIIHRLIYFIWSVIINKKECTVDRTSNGDYIAYISFYHSSTDDYAWCLACYILSLIVQDKCRAVPLKLIARTADGQCNLGYKDGINWCLLFIIHRDVYGCAKRVLDGELRLVINELVVPLVTNKYNRCLDQVDSLWMRIQTSQFLFGFVFNWFFLSVFLIRARRIRSQMKLERKQVVPSACAGKGNQFVQWFVAIFVVN